jgi:ferritin
MERALCEQINEELYSSYLYLSMSAHFEAKNLKGFASWMKVQAQEELVHVGKFFDFVNTRSGRVTLTPIAGPGVDWESPLAAFRAAHAHECHITDKINGLVDLALKLSDHATNNFLQWFVAEQVEEESTADDVVQQLTLIGDDPQGLFMLDRELAARTFVMPPAIGAGAGA